MSVANYALAVLVGGGSGPPWAVRASDDRPCFTFALGIVYILAAVEPGV